MVYFCLSSSSQPSSRCIINVENPPSAHAQQRHEDNDFHLRCAPVITKSSAVFVSGPAFLPFRRLPQPHRRHCFSLMAVFIFYTTGSLENGADLHPPCIVIVAHSGRPGADPASGCESHSPLELKMSATPSLCIHQHFNCHWTDTKVHSDQVQ